MTCEVAILERSGAVMRKASRLFGAGVAAAVAAGTMILTSAAPASAKIDPNKTFSSCQGTRVGTLRIPWETSKPKVGELRVWWNEQSGENCAMVYHTNSTVGKALRTGLFLRSCYQTEPSGPCSPVKDYGQGADIGVYKTYAGALKTKPGHRCIEVSGFIAMPLPGGGTYSERGYPNPTFPSKERPLKMGFCN